MGRSAFLGYFFTHTSEALALADGASPAHLHFDGCAAALADTGVELSDCHHQPIKSPPPPRTNYAGVDTAMRGHPAVHTGNTPDP